MEPGGTEQFLRVTGTGSAGASATVGLRSGRLTPADRAGPPRDGAIDALRARSTQCSSTGARSEYELGAGGLRLHSGSPVRRTGGEIGLPIRPGACLPCPAAL